MEGENRNGVPADRQRNDGGWRGCPREWNGRPTSSPGCTSADPEWWGLRPGIPPGYGSHPVSTRSCGGGHYRGRSRVAPPVSGGWPLQKIGVSVDVEYRVGVAKPTDSSRTDEIAAGENDGSLLGGEEEPVTPGVSERRFREPRFELGSPGIEFRFLELDPGAEFHRDGEFGWFDVEAGRIGVNEELVTDAKLTAARQGDPGDDLATGGPLVPPTTSFCYKGRFSR